MAAEFLYAGVDVADEDESRGISEILIAYGDIFYGTVGRHISVGGIIGIRSPSNLLHGANCMVQYTIKLSLKSGVSK